MAAVELMSSLMVQQESSSMVTDTELIRRNRRHFVLVVVLALALEMPENRGRRRERGRASKRNSKARFLA